MNSRERVHAALQHQRVDRVPVFMWFHPSTARRLARLLEIPIACVSEAMGDDVRQAWVGNNHSMEGITHERAGESHVDFWGIEWVREAEFNQPRRMPLADSSRAEVLEYQFPTEHLEVLLDQMVPINELRHQYFIGCDISPCLFEMYNRLRGMKNALIDLVADPNMVQEMLSRCADFCVQLSELACDRFALDWLWTGDDVGGQQAMLMSPQCWRRLFKPELRRIFAVGKSRALPVAYHGCGAIRPIIEDLIEIGMDVLNPIQCNYPGMDPLELKREFGSEIGFMGGVDTQGILPRGTADDVRRATERLIQGMTCDGGGYILGASHAVPPETPDENIFAMYLAAGISKEEIFDRATDIRARLMTPSC